jgi:FKBP-type peptidyl-prolyl cis-trans isomerase SlpA
VVDPSRGEKSQAIAIGSRVTLHLSLTLSDGTEALSTFGEEPMDLVVGDGTLSQGLELALYGLEAGDTETLELAPGQAFGARDESLIQTLPRSDFPADMALEAGLVIGFTTPSGEETAGLIRRLEGDQVQVDFNHPLAGRSLTLRLEVLDVINVAGQG